MAILTLNRAVKSFFFLCLLPIYQAHADPTIINNNLTTQAPPPAQQPQSPCGNNNTPNNGMRAGVYSTQNNYGGTDNLYTTGDKQPFYVDNNCNQSTMVQPYVYAQPGGPGPYPPNNNPHGGGGGGGGPHGGR